MARIKLGTTAEVWKDEPIRTDKTVLFALERPYALLWSEEGGEMYCERFFTDTGRHKKVVALRERGIKCITTYEDFMLDRLASNAVMSNGLSKQA